MKKKEFNPFAISIISSFVLFFSYSTYWYIQYAKYVDLADVALSFFSFSDQNNIKVETLLVVLIIWNLAFAFFQYCVFEDYNDAKNMRKQAVAESGASVLKLSFNEFMTYYNIEPKRYELGRGLIRVYSLNEKYSIDYSPKLLYIITFNFIDYLRYHSWKKNREFRKEQEKYTEGLSNYLAVVQNDIERFKTKQMEEEATQRQRLVSALSQIEIGGKLEK